MRHCKNGGWCNHYVPNAVREELEALRASHKRLLEVAQDFQKVIDDDPERYTIAEPTCNRCTHGNTPITYDNGPCAYHRLSDALAEAKKVQP